MDREQQLRQQAAQHTRAGSAVTPGMATAFPKNPPPPGMAYSSNFARYHQQGALALQKKD